ncbi:MAG TPA: endonuclease/exonuclease/phosphatase family protein [Reyranellaceae bacterium]|nr:endonuclease/exonuclease/phosphatase family protein [Reyranellaceae bacterium]
MKIISWNLLRRVGAEAEHVAQLIAREHPDLVLMQEATREIEALPKLAGGHFHRVPWASRIHGLAVWSRHHFAMPHTIALPMSYLPGRLPGRVSQVVQVGDIRFANVHLSHGQLLNRRQLARIAAALHGHPSAIIGDYNAVGPILLPGFRDVGPREPTHFASSLVPFRLDRCLVHGLSCLSSRALDFGPSDHKPIVLELQLAGAKTAPARAAAVAA